MNKTNLFKWLYLLFGCISLYGVYVYFTTRVPTTMLLVVVPFITCWICRVMYLKSLSEDQDKKSRKR